MATSAHPRTQLYCSRLVASAYSHEYKDGFQKKSDSRFVPARYLSGMSVKPACGDGPTENHGVLAGFQAVF